MPERLQSATDLADAIRRVADRAGSEMELQIEIEKLLDPFLPKIPGVTLDHYGHATKLGGIKDALHGNVIIEYERPGPHTDESISSVMRSVVKSVASSHNGINDRTYFHVVRRIQA